MSTYQKSEFERPTTPEELHAYPRLWLERWYSEVYFLRFYDLNPSVTTEMEQALLRGELELRGYNLKEWGCSRAWQGDNPDHKYPHEYIYSMYKLHSEAPFPSTKLTAGLAQREWTPAVPPATATKPPFRKRVSIEATGVVIEGTLP